MEQHKLKLVALAAMMVLGPAGALAQQQYEFVGQRFEVYDATKRANALVLVEPLPASDDGRAPPHPYVSPQPYASQAEQGSVASNPNADATSGAERRFEVYDATKPALEPVQVAPLPTVGSGRAFPQPDASQAGQGTVASNPDAAAASAASAQSDTSQAGQGTVALNSVVSSTSGTSTLPYASQSGQGSVALNPNADTTSGETGCPVGMVPLPIAVSGACVESNSPYVTSGRYQQDLAEAMQLPDRVRSKIIAAMSSSQTQSSQQPQVESIFDLESQDMQQAGTTSPATLSSSTTAQSGKIPPFPDAPDLKKPLPPAGTIPAAMSSYSPTAQSDDKISPSPVDPNVVTRTFDGGSYSFVKKPETSDNPIYKIGGVEVGGDDALIDPKPDINDPATAYSKFKPGLDLGDVRVAIDGGGAKGTCSYDLRAYEDAAPGCLVNVSGTCTTDDGRTFKSTGEAYRNLQGAWTMNTGIGSTEPGNPFASVELWANIQNDGTVSGQVRGINPSNPSATANTFASVSGKAYANNPVDFNASTDLKEATLSNGDKCRIGVNPWSTDSDKVIGDCTTPSGKSYRIDGEADSNIGPDKLTGFRISGFRDDGQRIWLYGNIASGGEVISQKGGITNGVGFDATSTDVSVTDYHDISDTQPAPVPVVAQSAPATPAPAVAQPVAAPVPVAAQPAPAPAPTQTAASISQPVQAAAPTQVAASISQPVQAAVSPWDGPTSCGSDEERRGAGWWDDPYVCVPKTPARSDDWGGNG